MDASRIATSPGGTGDALAGRGRRRTAEKQTHGTAQAEHRGRRRRAVSLFSYAKQAYHSPPPPRSSFPTLSGPLISRTPLPKTRCLRARAFGRHQTSPRHADKRYAPSPYPTSPATLRDPETRGCMPITSERVLSSSMAAQHDHRTCALRLPAWRTRERRKGSSSTISCASLAGRVYLFHFTRTHRLPSSVLDKLRTAHADADGIFSALLRRTGWRPSRI